MPEDQEKYKFSVSKTLVGKTMQAREKTFLGFRLQDSGVPHATGDFFHPFHSAIRIRNFAFRKPTTGNLQPATFYPDSCLLTPVSRIALVGL
jgi:hypothetical protein